MLFLTFIQICVIVLGPWLCIRTLNRFPVSWLSPVVLAYGTGILLANLGGFPIDQSVSSFFSQATVVLAIPMLLFNTDLRSWLQQARATILSFVLVVISGLLSSLFVAWLLHGQYPDAWQLSGMLTGVFTGGTPNMQAIGLALGVEEEVYVLMNAADIFCGGIYLIFLTSIAHKILGVFLPDFKKQAELILTETDAFPAKIFSWKDRLLTIALTVVILMISIIACQLIFNNLQNSAFIILMLSALSVLAAFHSRVRELNGAYEMGEYLLLMFCIAVGMLADFANLWQEGSAVIFYTAAVLSLTVGLHFLLSAMFRIDRDTTLIISTAAVYGPAFIGQVASAIKNRQLIFSGIASGLVGFAIGNFLGIGIAELIRWWLY